MHLYLFYGLLILFYGLVSVSLQLYPALFIQQKTVLSVTQTLFIFRAKELGGLLGCQLNLSQAVLFFQFCLN